MINIYVSDTVPDMPLEKWLLIKQFYNDKIIDRLAKSPGDTYMLRRFTSRLLLIKIFEDLGISLQHLDNLYYNRYGKLVIKHCAYKISISYSNDKTICMVSNDKLGLDVEDIRREPKRQHLDLLKQLTSTQISDHIDFYYAWTKMESIAKIYDDKGLGAVIHNPKKYGKHFTRQFLLNQNYLVSISSVKEFDTVPNIKILNA